MPTSLDEGAPHHGQLHGAHHVRRDIVGMDERGTGVLVDRAQVRSATVGACRDGLTIPALVMQRLRLLHDAGLILRLRIRLKDGGH